MEEAQLLLGVSEKLLGKRDFSGCRKYALQALELDPSLSSAVGQLRSIADVLLSTSEITRTNPSPNYYSVLQLPPLTQDSSLIKESFKNFLVLLNPTKNKFPLAKEAFDLVRDAYKVLSHPVKKDAYDASIELKNETGNKMRQEVVVDLFWTICPYCYYLYEYESIYVQCCLKCQNCEKAFHGVELSNLPAFITGKDGYYCCFGYFQLGYRFDCKCKPAAAAATATEPSDSSNGKSGVSAKIAKKKTPRKKMAAWSAKKILGTGFRTKRSETETGAEVETVNLDSEAVKDVFEDGKVEYIEGDNDIYVQVSF